jgi:hypothetical protein
MGISLQNEATMRLKHVPSIYNSIMEQIKEDLKEGPLWISTDCSRDAMGREVANVIVGTLNSEEYKKPHLVNVTFLEKADSGSMARLGKKLLL